jgi:hypothetical protein
LGGSYYSITMSKWLDTDEPVVKTIMNSSYESITITGERVDVRKKKYNVCFYNAYHFGDIYFTHPCVKHICESNPDVTFYYWYLFGHSAFEGTPNLIHLEPIDSAKNSRHEISINYISSSPENNGVYKKHHNLFYEIYPDFKKDFATFEFHGMSFVAFNTWWPSLYRINDMDYIFLLSSFKRKMMFFNEVFGLSLKFDFENHKMFPELPIVPMTDRFSAWLPQNREKKRVFIYNYEPRAVRGFMNVKQINAIIVNICISNPHLHVIVPRYDEAFDGIENVTFCDRDFGFTENRTCLNLVQIEHILQYCRLVVTLPSGSTWTFMNRHLSSYLGRTAFYLWGDYLEYAKRLNNWYRYAMGKTDNIIQCVGIHGLETLVRNFNY